MTVAAFTLQRQTTKLCAYNDVRNSQQNVFLFLELLHSTLNDFCVGHIADPFSLTHV